MNRGLQLIGRLAAGRPGAALLGLLLVTVVLGFFAVQVSSESELTEFSPDTDRAVALDIVQVEFGGQSEVVQILVQPVGADANVLSPDGLRFADALKSSAIASAGEAAIGGSSYADGFVADGLDLATATSQDVAAAAPGAIENGATALLSRQFDRASVSASAGLVVVPLDPALDEETTLDVALDIREAVSDVPAPQGLEAIPFSASLLLENLSSGVNSDLPRLLALSLLLVVLILFYTFRAVSDVVLGFAGLVITIVWTYGVAALLGPDYLGVTGPLSQISTIVPVLLVGLGIDYAIHLTGRYREQERAGSSPSEASRVAVLVVGGALILATATTVVGFATNVTSPLPPIADFGIFTAVGVIAAFIVFVVLVPSARHLLDRRSAAHPPGRPMGASDPVGLARIMAATAVIAERHAWTVIAGTVGVTAFAIVAAAQVDTTFDQREFIPEGSDGDRALSTFDNHFGGDISERTYVLATGDMTNPAIANAFLDVAASLEGSPLVRTTSDGGLDLVSPAQIVAQTVDAEAGTSLGWDGQRFTSDADVAALYELAREEDPRGMSLTLRDGQALIAVATTGGQTGAGAIAELFVGVTAPVREAGASVTVTSEPIVLDETLDSLQSSQVRGIGITLIAATLLLVGYFSYAHRQPRLGLITIAPSALVTAWIAGSMWALGLSFNVLTTMVAALAIGIAVPYGIHVTHRFQHELRRYGDDPDAALREVITHTGGALLGSATTTAAGFGVLALSSLTPIRQFGIVIALSIVYALIAATIVQPALLRLFAAGAAGQSAAEEEGSRLSA